MKKIGLIIIILFFLTGCYDYNDLTDLGIVTGVGIDYQNNEFEVTYEIVSTKKTGDTSASTSSYTVSAKSNTISEAFQKNGNNMDKVAYFDHIAMVIISEEVAKNHLEELAEFIVRSTKFRNEVYTGIVINGTAKEMISKSSKENPLASHFLVDMLENSNDASGAGYYAPFTLSLRHILTDGEDAIMPTFSLKENKIILTGMGIFKDFKLKNILDIEQASIINLMNNFKAKTIYFESTCSENKKTTINIYRSKIEFLPSDEYLTIKGKLNGEITQNDCNLDLKEPTTYDKLESEFLRIIENKMTETINSTKTSESNALGIGKKYYDKYRINNPYLWMSLPMKYDLNFKINKKGLTFELESGEE